MRTLAVAAITGLIALAMAGAATAAPSVSLVWTGTTGGGTTGGSSITAVAGDTLTLDMQVTSDSLGLSAVALSMDISTGGVVSAYTRPGIDSINDGAFTVWDYQPTGNLAPASATYTGPGLTYLSGITCPLATGNVFTGQCGTFGVGLLGAAQFPSDLGGGIIGSFGTNPGAQTGPHTMTIAQAVFVVVPEPATGGLLALGLGALAFIGRRRA
jgi:hypothetical protein